MPDQPTEAEAAAFALANLTDTTPNGIYRGTQGFSERALVAADIGAGGGGGSLGGLTLVGPFSVDYDTPGFFNPDSSNGVETLSIPAGTIVLPFAIVTEGLEGAQAGDELILLLLVDANGNGPVLARYDFNSLTAPSPTIALNEAANPAFSGEYRRTFGLAVDDCKIVAAYYPAGATTLTAGSIDIYALVAAEGGGGGGGGGSQPQLALGTLAHSAAFANVSASVFASTTAVAGRTEIVLPASAFGNGGTISVQVGNTTDADILASGGLIVQNADGTAWIEQDSAGFETVIPTDTILLDLSLSGGSGGAGLSWDAEGKTVVIASAGAYSAFAIILVKLP